MHSDWTLTTLKKLQQELVTNIQDLRAKQAKNQNKIRNLSSIKLNQTLSVQEQEEFQKWQQDFLVKKSNWIQEQIQYEEKNLQKTHQLSIDPLSVLIAQKFPKHSEKLEQFIQRQKQEIVNQRTKTQEINKENHKREQFSNTPIDKEWIQKFDEFSNKQKEWLKKTQEWRMNLQQKYLQDQLTKNTEIMKTRSVSKNPKKVTKNSY